MTRELAILAFAIGFVIGIIGGMSLTQWALPILQGPRMYLALAPTCDVIGTAPPELLEARR